MPSGPVTVSDVSLPSTAIGRGKTHAASGDFLRAREPIRHEGALTTRPTTRTVMGWQGLIYDHDSEATRTSLLDLAASLRSGCGPERSARRRTTWGA